MVKRVCFVSSGTGGHLLPAMVLADALRERGHDPLLLAEGRPAEKALRKRLNCIAEDLSVGGSGLGLPVRLMSAAWRARRFLCKHDVDLVVGTGGRTTVPVALAARSLGRPICLMEQNATPGRANRWLMPLARRIYLGLPTKISMPRSLLTGTPIRNDLRNRQRGQARRQLGFTHGDRVVFVTGGSQGAEILNRTVPEAIRKLSGPVQVIHLAGQGNEGMVQDLYRKAALKHDPIIRPVMTDMATLYAAADLVICRGGGGTIAELIAAGRGAIIVPYPHHKDRQQFHNGKVLESAGAAIVVEQQDLAAQPLAELIDRVVFGDQAEEMGHRAALLATHDAAQRILDDILSMLATDQ